MLRPDRLLSVEFSSSGNGDGGGVTSKSLFLSSSSHRGRLRFFDFEKLIVVLVGFFLDGDVDFTLGFFFLVELTTGAASLNAAVESSALADSVTGGTSPRAMLVSIVLVSAPLSSSIPASPFLAFFLEIRMRLGLGGFT